MAKLLQLAALELDKANAQVVDQAVWALGNIAGDSYLLRDCLLARNVLPTMMALVQQQDQRSIAENAAWVMSNLMRGKPPPLDAMVAPAVPLALRLVEGSQAKLAEEALWALVYYTNVKPRSVALASPALFASLVQLMGTAKPAPLALLTALVRESEEECVCEEALAAGVLQALARYQAPRYALKVLRVVDALARHSAEGCAAVVREGCFQNLPHLLASPKSDTIDAAISALAGAVRMAPAHLLPYFCNAAAATLTQLVLPALPMLDKNCWSVLPLLREMHARDIVADAIALESLCSELREEASAEGRVLSDDDVALLYTNFRGRG